MKYPDPRTYEVNYTSDRRTPDGLKYYRDPKGWGVRLNKKSKDELTPRDYRYFEMPPHPGHRGFHSDQELKEHRDNAYPWERIQIGSAEDVEANKAHLPIEDREVKEYVPHPFDKHPVLVNDIVPNRKSDSYSADPQGAAKMVSAVDEWRAGPERSSWLEMPGLEQRMERDRSIRPNHVHEGISPTPPRPHHVSARQRLQMEVPVAHWEKEPKTKKEAKREAQLDLKMDPQFKRQAEEAKKQLEEIRAKRQADPAYQREMRAALASRPDLAAGIVQPKPPVSASKPQTSPAAPSKVQMPSAHHEYDLSVPPEGSTLHHDEYHALPDSMKTMMHRSHGSKPKQPEIDISSPPEGASLSHEEYHALPDNMKMLIHKSHGPKR